MRQAQEAGCSLLREMLCHYIAHQKDVVTRRSKYDLDKAEAHFYLGGSA